MELKTLKPYAPFAAIVLFLPFFLAPLACFSIPTGSAVAGPQVDYQLGTQPFLFGDRTDLVVVMATGHLTDGSACHTFWRLHVGSAEYSTDVVAATDGTLFVPDPNKPGQHVLTPIGTYERVDNTGKVTLHLAQGSTITPVLTEQATVGTSRSSPAYCNLELAIPASATPSPAASAASSAQPAASPSPSSSPGAGT